MGKTLIALDQLQNAVGPNYSLVTNAFGVPIYSSSISDSISMLSGYTGLIVTGGTYSSGVITFTDLTGGTFSVTGLYTGSTDVYVTGGTYNSTLGIATFTNNTGGTFSVSGFSDIVNSVSLQKAYDNGNIILNNGDGLSTNYENYLGYFDVGGGHSSNERIYQIVGDLEYSSSIIIGGVSLACFETSIFDNINLSFSTSRVGTNNLLEKPNVDISVSKIGDGSSIQRFILPEPDFIEGESIEVKYIPKKKTLSGTYELITSEELNNFIPYIGATANVNLGNNTISANGVTANTISATTYLGLPLDVYTTGATLVGKIAFFDRNNSLSAYTLNLSGLSEYYYPLTGNPANYLIDKEVLNFSAFTQFPISGQSGIIYVSDDDGLAYTWNGTTYVAISRTGIAGSGTTNYIPKFTSFNSIGNSRFIDFGLNGGRYGEVNNSVEFISGANRYLRLARAQSFLEFILGNFGVSQPNVINSNNLYGFAVFSNGKISFHTGGLYETSNNEGLRILTGGTIMLPITPSAGTISDSILVRDTSGNVKTINTSILSSTFTGGTVTGQTNFTNGLTANTISATTYYNLPPINLDNLSDVTILSGITSGDTLMYNGSVWENINPFDYFDAKPIIYQKHINIPAFGSPSINNVEGVTMPITGPVARNWADTDIITRTQRIGINVSVTTNTAQIRQTIVYFSRNGGFNLLTGFNMAENATDTAIRFFIGISTNIIFTNVEPNTLLNCVGICRLSTSNNLHIVYNDNTGIGTTIDLGSNFPANTISTDKYLLKIKAVSTGIYIKLERVGTAFSYETTLTSDIPSTSTGLNFGAYIVDTSGPNATTGFDWYGSYIMTNN